MARHGDDQGSELKTHQSSIATRGSFEKFVVESPSASAEAEAPKDVFFILHANCAARCAIWEARTERFASSTVFSSNPPMMPMFLSPLPQDSGWSWMPVVLTQLAQSFFKHVRCTCSA